MSSLALAKSPNDRSMQAQWDPWNLLDIYPEDGEFSCIGVGLSGSRCGWQFWHDWTAAEADLELMSTMHPSQISKDILTTLAKHSLCAKNHQYQARFIVEDWRIRIALADELRKVKAELEEMRKQNASPSELASLRGKVVESAVTLQALRESETARRVSEITSLEKRLAASDLTILILEHTQKNNLEEIERLKEKCVLESNRASVATELYQVARHESTRLQTDRDAKTEEVDRLKQDVWNLEADLEESQRIQKIKGRETDNLRQQFNASDALIKKLQATKIDTTCLYQGIENINRTLTESNTEVFQLQQENQRLKTQKYFWAFRDHVRLLTKEKTYERVAMENQTLSEQVARLTQRLEEADMQLAAQDVSNTFFIPCRQTIH